MTWAGSSTPRPTAPARDCGSSRTTSASCSTIPGSPGGSRKFATGWPRRSAGSTPALLIGSRDTREDVGTHIMTPSEQIRENPRAVLAANFKRIAEALRSLEEYSKLVDVWLAGRFEVLRYDIYTIEKLTMTAVAAHRSAGRRPADGPDRRSADARRSDLDRRARPSPAAPT